MRMYSFSYVLLLTAQAAHTSGGEAQARSAAAPRRARCRRAGASRGAGEEQRVLR
jgi:hypothetical protein